MTRKYGSFRSPNFDPDKILEYSHREYSEEFKNGIKVKIQHNGRVVITQDHADGTFEEIDLPASVIYKTAFKLDETRETRIVTKDEFFKEK